MKIKPNTLVAYKGGGYDGCFWEWNYAYIDKSGEFHSIFASGRNGCDNREELENCEDPYDFDLYDMGNAEDRRRFGSEEGVRGTVLCARWFAENTDTRIKAKCDRCGCQTDVLGHGSWGDYAGEGGTSYFPQHIFCGKHPQLREDY